MELSAMAHLKLFFISCLSWHSTASFGVNPARDGRTLFNRQPRIDQCGGTSRAIVTHLQQPPLGADSRRSSNADCIYTIRANSRRICQLRIDFDTSLAAPNVTLEKPFPHCTQDALRVDGLDVAICGQNHGQHVYVPWNVQSLWDTKQIRIHLVERRASNGSTAAPLPAATWSMRVTQIECQENGFFWQRDSALRAPAGCLQYFTDRSGTFESFNFNQRQGPYFGDLTYGICFRRRSNDAELRLQSEFFEMSKTVGFGPGYDADCTAQVITTHARQDFLAVSEASFTTAAKVRMVANRFCGTAIAPGQVIATRAPGPFMIHVSTDQQTSTEEKGFRFAYSVL